MEEFKLTSMATLFTIPSHDLVNDRKLSTIIVSFSNQRPMKHFWSLWVSDGSIALDVGLDTVEKNATLLKRMPPCIIVGDGAKCRRTFGQEIFSPLLLAFAKLILFSNNRFRSYMPFVISLPV
ncbi:hypothetical protein CTI12_AA050940 [Artemisia annua]|uniref:Uncharacterized protein n=1 Tax=Artemisia annua TaxID=35608 RepID=A0A2U1QBK5_ARTAN|nr:hypothetical protein CTI12_AA050940 [Artemisia annua]